MGAPNEKCSPKADFLKKKGDVVGYLFSFFALYAVYYVEHNKKVKKKANNFHVHVLK